MNIFKLSLEFSLNPNLIKVWQYAFNKSVRIIDVNSNFITIKMI